MTRIMHCAGGANLPVQYLSLSIPMLSDTASLWTIHINLYAKSSILLRFGFTKCKLGCHLLLSWFWKNAYSFFAAEPSKMHWRLQQQKSMQSCCLKTKISLTDIQNFQMSKCF